MKVLILNPSSKFSKNTVRDVLYGCWCKGKRIGGGTVPPFALLQAATVLKKSKHRVQFIDAQAQGLDLASLQPIVKTTDIVVISTSTMTFGEDVQLLSQFKRMKPQIKTIIFGSHPTFLPNHSLGADSVDIIIRREPYFILRDLLAALAKQDLSWKTIRGIGFKESGLTVLNPLYEFIDLNQLPIPDLDLLPKDTLYFNPLVRRLPYITSVTSNGCPGKCTFCTAPYFDGMQMRYKSRDYVIREIEYYRDKGIREVYFRDDTFFVDKARDRLICQEMVSRKIDISWLCNTRVDMVERDLFKLAKEAGCHTVKIGIESGVQRILDGVKKGYKLEQGIEAFDILSQIGIRTHAHVMLGMPDETEDTVRETLRYVLALNPTTVTFGICTPYPGTPLYSQLVNSFPEIGDGTKADFSKLHTQGVFNEYYTDLKKERLERYVKQAYRRFYLRPGYFIKTIKSLRTKEDINRIARAAYNVLDFSIRGE